MPRTPRKVPSRRHRTPRRGGVLPENVVERLRAAAEELDDVNDNYRAGRATDEQLETARANHAAAQAAFQAQAARVDNSAAARQTAEYAQAAVDRYPLTPVIVNEASRFVVATYWWGRGRANANTQWPCPDVIMSQIKSDLEEELVNDDKQYGDFIKNEWQYYLDQVESPDGEWLNPSPEIMTSWLKAKATRLAYLADYFAKQTTKDLISQRMVPSYNARPPSTNPEPRRQGDGGLTKQPITYDEMIAKWEQTCREKNCNYMTVEYPEFAMPGRYQSAINAKPLFIKKAVQSCGGRGVLYIDGDMFIRKYPKIFDIQNVDFMAHGWNCDPRSNIGFKEWQCFDPHIFETSGGTMFFANTPAAINLLDTWATESHKPENYGKADDRLLSMVFTMQNIVLPVNLIQLPIEYLWLTDKYNAFDFEGAADIADCIIEHPACLTAEEAAADQGASNDRYPPGYDKAISDRLNCNRPGGLFYEYIMFPNPGTVDAFAPYLRWMANTINSETGLPMFKVIPFDRTFGDYDAVAARNQMLVKKFEEERGIAPLPSGTFMLPQTAPIHEILFYLLNGISVSLGKKMASAPGIEIIATNRGRRASTNYLADIKVDIAQPIFFSCRSRTVRLLLQMCATLEDINTHLSQSYVFISRIRWYLIQQGPSTRRLTGMEIIQQSPPVLAEVPLTERQLEVKERLELEARMLEEAKARPSLLGSIQKNVHQIWFGGEIPAWRQYLFDINKAAAERNGYTYKLWQNADRTRENFESTFAYQEDALAVGADTGQSRWAQVADLARIEIVYKNGGIYIDSLFETGDDFYKKITDLSLNNTKFVGCNEDPCKLDCVGAGDRKYLSNSFFAAAQWCPVLERLLVENGPISHIDMANPALNQTTGPYYLRQGIVDPVADGVFMLETEEIYPFPMSGSTLRPAQPNPFLLRAATEDSIQVNPTMWLEKNALQKLQAQNRPIRPLALYHVGLGGTWST
jgi:hypothetical protein